MPKKGKGKQPAAVGAGKASKSSTEQEPLPQVWLPNQPDLGSLDPDTEDAQGTLPSEQEQEQMAHFWALEEANAPRGWDEDKELDYTEISRKKEKESGDKKAGGAATPDLFKYAQSSVSDVRFLGHLGNVHGRRGSETQTDILEAIDTAQRQGRLPWVSSDQDQRSLSISKYGVKVMDVKKQRVYARHALHCIANITYYEDTYGKHMLAMRIGRPDVEHYDLYIYECKDEAQAKDICLTLAQAFEAVLNRMKLEQNLHTSDLR